MTIEITQLIIITLILLAASTAQSAVGFGYALFATPLLVWSGIELPNAIALVATCSMVQASIGVYRLREDVPLKLALSGTGIRLISVLIGLFILKNMLTLEIDQIRLIIGSIICLLVFLQLAWRPHPVEKLHWAWGGLAFSTSGIIAGICGMGGPPLVMWAMAHDWTPHRTRGFLFAVFASSIPLQLCLMCFTISASILWYVLLGLAMAPAVFVGTTIGIPIGNKLGKQKLRYIAYAILLIIGLTSIIPAIIKQFQ